MSHFYFPAHETVILSTELDGQRRTAHHRNPPINLELVLSFEASTSSYDFSLEAGQKAQIGIIPVIRFQVPGDSAWFWCFDSKASRDAELRALHNHLVNQGS